MKTVCKIPIGTMTRQPSDRRRYKDAPTRTTPKQIATASIHSGQLFAKAKLPVR
jgi:hypothetical protein